VVSKFELPERQFVKTVRDKIVQKYVVTAVKVKRVTVRTELDRCQKMCA